MVRKIRNRHFDFAQRDKSFVTRHLSFVILFLVYCLLPTVYCFSQAYQLTQFYAAPTFLNPAFAGTAACARLVSNYRVQWPSIPGAFTTSMVALDNSLKKKSSIGFLFVSDRAGSGNLRSTSFNGQYSYQLVLNREWAFNAGFEAGYTIRDYNFSKFIFGDQIAYNTPTSVEQPRYDKVQYLDLASGALLYSEKSWFGFSARHLNMPNQAILGGESRLPVLYSVHGGIVIPLSSKGGAAKVFTRHSITPSINYRHEKKFDQMDVGCYYTYNPFSLGIWYRGIPLLKGYQLGYRNDDAIAFLAGVAAGQLKIGYSYDYTISHLMGFTGGAHEVSLSFQFCNPKKKKMKSIIACPKF